MRIARSLRTALMVGALFLFLLAWSSHAAGATEQRTFRNEHAGKVTLLVPKDWVATARHHITFGTTFYRLVPPRNEFSLEILVNDLAHMHMTALVEGDLEIYIERNMARAAPRSTEGRATARRFGAQRNGVYARLTDKAPGPGEFVLFTQGVWLVGKNVVLFTLYSNDHDGAVLKQVLELVDSVTFEP